jgi:dTDP-4-amino-4,6-dideoxygalactose transaminase
MRNSLQMMVPLLDLKAQYASIRREVETAIGRVVESQHFIQGPEVEDFEKEIAAYCRCDFAIGLSSGTDALVAALMAIGLQPGDEVITTPYSFFATAGSIARLGARPVFVDVEAGTLNIDAARIESRITSRTRAIIAVHLFGQMADMTAIGEIGRRRGLCVIEDAAQAIGAERDGRRAGSIGDIACFSFFPSKNLGAFGDAGMITTNDPRLDDRVRLLRNHGSRTKYDNRIVGGNFRLDAIQAAVLRVKLKHLDNWSERRRSNAGLYRQLLAGSHVQLPADVQGGRHIYNQFVIRTHGRDELMARMKDRGVGVEIYYPKPLHLQECFRDLGYKSGDFPVSEEAAKDSLALPVYPELTPEMIRYVADAILN